MLYTMPCPTCVQQQIWLEFVACLIPILSSIRMNHNFTLPTTNSRSFNSHNPKKKKNSFESIILSILVQKKTKTKNKAIQTRTLNGLNNAKSERFVLNGGLEHSFTDPKPIWLVVRSKTMCLDERDS